MQPVSRSISHTNLEFLLEAEQVIVEVIAEKFSYRNVWLNFGEFFHRLSTSFIVNSFCEEFDSKDWKFGGYNEELKFHIIIIFVVKGLKNLCLLFTMRIYGNLLQIFYNEIDNGNNKCLSAGRRR